MSTERLELDARAGHVRSHDGTPIAWFAERPTPRSGGGEDGAGVEVTAGRPGIVLVHGTTADHQTWRVLGPLLAARHPIVSIDRRGRGASGDTAPYAIGREFEDVAAVARALASTTGGPVAVVGHSFGGRCALGAAGLEPSAIGWVVTYEGAVAAHVGTADLDRLEALAAAGDGAALLEVFLRDVVEMTDVEWQRFRDAPVWPDRVAAAPTIVREVRAGGGEAAAWAGYADVRQPVLQLLGSESPPYFRAGAEALGARLADGRVVVIEGARHSAHHTHAEAMRAAIEAFLAGR